MRKTAIVTGASSGFGLLIAIELAKLNFRVIACMRNMEKSPLLLQKASEFGCEKNIEVFPLDVRSEDSIVSLRRKLQELDSVDVLVNNAGYAHGGFCEEITVQDYRSQFETNVFGLISVTQCVLPLMRKNNFGRIINMSSISGKFGFPGLSAYTSSKHAIEGFSESLRLEVKPFGIDVTLIEPGSYRTNIWSSIDTTEINENSPYHKYMSGILNEINGSKNKHGDPLDVAKLVAKIASQKKRPKLRYPIGKGVIQTLLMKKFVPWETIEKAVLKKFK
ncbi:MULTISPECIES: SDR family oxidoreductase [unclassified Bacillus (in: firmicutes)]|uniref:SDR family oxidoreductase n=1 Tax=unclassified Bacillus (in: firmicutes) TaxID=185979 RepID=UPI0008EA25E0|nr:MULTISPECIES: SDR family oxidoreductase [unclassified Bacillus (in: firmicutes)]SFA86692.1 short chain dehydrogenase [Bacillus sp. UNCCL13]SFQ83821.1 short chain dehydrogenase [Bacillus sp. cl95]